MSLIELLTWFPYHILGGSAHVLKMCSILFHHSSPLYVITCPHEFNSLLFSPLSVFPPSYTYVFQKFGLYLL